jgi:hypothetical protein
MPVNAPGAQGFVVDAGVQAELIAMRQESLRAIEDKKAKAIEVAAVPCEGGQMADLPLIHVITFRQMSDGPQTLIPLAGKRRVGLSQ